ncbi:MAG TPA: hypothetical protein VK555_07805 [Terriglobales bacterium]|nr:hypothetical protein [Terriglobales bacterium]
MNENRALEQQFLDRAKALTNVAEVFRCLQVTMLICDMVAFGVRAEAKIFEAAYGEPSGQKYWDAHLSEPIRVYTLAHVLSAHLAEQAEQVEMARIAIIRAFRDAAEAGERWFTGDTTPLLAVEDGQTNFEGLAKIKLYPRPAVEWLLSKPKRVHLVPTSLQRFLQSGGEPTNAQVPTVNAQIAAEANFELARVRAAFEAAVARMSISHMSNAGPGDTCSTG